MAALDVVLHPDFEFIRSKKFRNGDLWEVKKKRCEEPCRRCGTLSSIRYGKTKVLVRERGIQDGSLWLLVHKHRLYCKSCRKPFTETTRDILESCGMPHEAASDRFVVWVGIMTPSLYSIPINKFFIS